MHKIFYLILGAVLLFSACIQDADEDNVPVRYTVLVRDGRTGEAVSGASVELTGEDTVSRTLSTNNNGKVVFPAIKSYVNQVIVSKSGYVPTDTVDVISSVDSTTSVLLRTLNLVLLPKGYSSSDTGKIYSYTVTILDKNTMSGISGASVSVTSGSTEFSAVKTSSSGRAVLDSLPSKQNLFSISASGYIPIDTLVIADTTSNDHYILQTLKVLLSPAVSK
ncbi:MAG: hypothetical protein M0P13_09535 [Fibrobacteraceae bacterium]|nr:hypothetical protein [Fibrobacteraceae bacterium]